MIETLKAKRVMDKVNYPIIEGAVDFIENYLLLRCKLVFDMGFDTVWIEILENSDAIPEKYNFAMAQNATKIIQMYGGKAEKIIINGVKGFRFKFTKPP